MLRITFGTAGRGPQIASSETKYYMMGINRVRGRVGAPAVVGVIASAAALAAAKRLRRPPDLFELRLDMLCHSLEMVDRAIPELRAPLIFTVRDPAEGGRGRLQPKARRALFERFLGHAAFIDIELRSIRQMRRFIQETREQGIGLIVSWHDINGKVTRSMLLRKARSAASAGATIFKIATRTDTRTELARVISLFQKAPPALPIAAMGIGKLGRVSRVELARLGSVLTYVSVGAPTVAGQISLSQLRCRPNAYGI
jgi:3-dehydroquinate dehydratase-1